MVKLISHMHLNPPTCIFKLDRAYAPKHRLDCKTDKVKIYAQAAQGAVLGLELEIQGPYFVLS